MVGNVHRCVEFWRTEIRPPPRVMDWITNKIHLRVLAADKLAQQPLQQEIPLTREERFWTTRELERLCQITAIELVGQGSQRPEGLKEVSSIFLISKPGPKKYRLVVDMRRLNTCLEDHHFKMEGISTFLRSVGKGWWCFAMDLDDGYHHVGMSDPSKEFLGFRFANRWYRFRVLPFGLSQAVWIFCKITRALIVKWRRQGIVTGAYVDDFWVAHPSREILEHIQRTVIEPDL